MEKPFDFRLVEVIAALLFIAFVAIGLFLGLPSWVITISSCGAAFAWMRGPHYLAFFAYRRRQFDKAIGICDFLLRLNPYDSWALSTAAAANFSLDRHDRAIELYSRAISLNARDVLAFTNRSIAKSSTFRYEEALADADQAVRIKPEKNPYAFWARCLAHCGLNDYNQAERDYMVAMNDFGQKISPEILAGLLTVHAWVLCARGNLDEALDNTAQALQLYPQNGYVWINRAHYLMVAGRVDEALDVLQDADELSIFATDRERAFLASNRARAETIRNNSELALELSDAALSLYESAAILCTRAIVMIRAGRGNEAIDYLEKAVSINPHEPEIYYFKAELLKQNGDQEEANLQEQKALALGYMPYI